MTTELTWRKSNYSGGQGNCVELADQSGRVLVRDSQDRDGLVLAFSADAWRQFADQLREC